MQKISDSCIIYASDRKGDKDATITSITTNDYYLRTNVFYVDSSGSKAT